MEDLACAKVGNTLIDMITASASTIKWRTLLIPLMGHENIE